MFSGACLKMNRKAAKKKSREDRKIKGSVFGVHFLEMSFKKNKRKML